MAFSKEYLASLAIRLGIDSSAMGPGVAKAKSNMLGLEKSIKSVGIAFAATFALSTLNKWAKEGYDSNQKQLKSEKLLLTALKGRSDVQQRLIDQATFIQSKTLFGDEEIINQQKMLAALGFSEMQIRNVSDAAIQLSTTLGITLSDAFKMLSKTYSGYTRELGRLVPEIKNMSKEQLAAGGAVSWVNKNMTDLAETAANTDPVAKNILLWTEFKELFGKGVAPALNSVFEGMNRLLTILGSDKVSTLTKVLSALRVIGKEGKQDIARQISDQLANQDTDNWLKAFDEWLVNFNKGARNLVPELSIIEELNNELKHYQELWGEATTEADLALYGRKIQLLEQEIKRLRELGTLLTDIERKRSLTGMAKDVKGSMSTPKDASAALYVPTSKPGITAPGITKEGKLDFGTVDSFAAFNASRDAMVNATYESYEKMKQMTADFTQSIEYMFEDMAVGFAEAIGQMIASGAKNKWTALLYPIAEAMSALGKMAIAEGVVITGLKKALQSMNGYVAIAAGVALVAVASAIKSNLSNMASNMGSGSVSMPVSSQSSGNDFISRGFGEGNKMTVEVIGFLRNDHISLSSKRGQAQSDRY